MRALESFHEAEQIRLALRDTLRVQRAVYQADQHHQLTVPSRRSTPSRPASAIGSELTTVTTEDEETGNVITRADETSAQTKAAVFTEGQSLIGSLPDAVVLEDIVGNYLDFDSILLTLPYLSQDWYKSIWGSTCGALLWRRLCVRAWSVINLPYQRMLANVQGNDWQAKFLKRPSIRLSGPYITYTIFIQHPGPRNLWTPKDAPAVKVVYHYRFWWFREDNTVCYIALATRNPEKIIELMRKELVASHNGTNQHYINYSSSSGVPPESAFWYGTYHVFRGGDASTPNAPFLCDVDVPHARHGVKFRFELCPGGHSIKIVRHQSYRFKTPDDLMFHQLPEYDEDRHYKYRPGFL